MHLGVVPSFGVRLQRQIANQLLRARMHVAEAYDAEAQRRKDLLKKNSQRLGGSASIVLREL